MSLEEVSRYLGHFSTVPTRRYAQQTPEELGERAADALVRAGLVAGGPWQLQVGARGLEAEMAS